MLDFINKLPYKYWDIKTKIDYIQRRIIIYAIQYYELNNSIVTDKYYDRISEYLVYLKTKYPDDYKNSEYYYCLYDFDKSTGFYIYSRLNKKDKIKLTRIANYILMCKK